VGNSPLDGLDPYGLDKFERMIDERVRRQLAEKYPHGITSHIKQLSKGTLGYYQNYGWIDWNHANPELAASILRKVRAGKDDTRGASQRSQRPDSFNPLMGKPPFFIISVLEQGERNWTTVANPIRLYAVKCGLTNDEQTMAALGIFRDYQYNYEQWQGSNWLFRTLTSSSFSQEDLPSDLLGFYMALGGGDLASGDTDTRKKTAVARFGLGRELPMDDALRLLNRLGGDLGAERNKNYTFDPIDHNAMVGWPKMQVAPIFKSIVPAVPWFKWANIGFAPTHMDGASPAPPL
jgi:hypothetical protein